MVKGKNGWVHCNTLKISWFERVIGKNGINENRDLGAGNAGAYL